MTAAPQQIEVCYSGRVQGVGFRYTVRSIARGYDVAGFVRNLRDGRVQLVAEGREDVLREFLAEVRREMGHYIRDAHESVAPAAGRFDGFEIRF